MRHYSFIQVTLMWLIVVGYAALSAGQDIGEIAAKQFYAEGGAAMARNDLPAAAKKFAQAVRSAPNNGNYRAALSAVLLQQGRLPSAWKQARKAQKLAPTDERVGAQLLAVWSAFGQQQLFQAGNSPDRIRTALGEPDRSNALGPNQRWIYGFMAIDWSGDQLYSSIDLRGMDRGDETPLSRLVLELDPIWKVSFRVADRMQQTTRYIRTQEATAETAAAEATESNKDNEPTGALIIQRLYRVATEDTSPRQWMERARRAARAANAVAQWEILAEGQDRIVYEWSSKATDKQPVRYELAVAMMDDRDLHVAAYSQATLDVPEERREEWIERFRLARLEPLAAPAESIPEKALAPATDG